MDKKIEKLFSDYSDILYQFLLKLTRSPEAADDLIQDVFVSAIQYYNSDIRNEKSWLFTIAYNKFTKYYRQQCKYNENTREVDENNISGSYEFYNTEWKLLRESILETLEKESSLLKELFILRVDYSFTHAEISNILEISVSKTARSFKIIQKILYKNYKEELNLSFLQ